MNGNSSSLDTCPGSHEKGEAPRATGRKYWRSLNELADKPGFREFVEREFPAHASEWLGSNESRRTFLKVMGASMALAGLASCRRWPEEKLAPYAHRPANRMDGVPVHYATAYERSGMGVGVVAVSFDGRPIKTDGNPTHPLSRGTSDIFLQASVLNVYDPDRSRGVVHRAGGTRAESSWQEFLAALKAAGVSNTGAGLVVLTEASRSPSVAAVRGQLREARFFEYEVISNDNQRAGVNLLSGRPLRAVPHLDQAPVIVSIDADLFFGEPLAIKFNREFAAGRMLRDDFKAPTAEMNRLYVIESGYTITGSMAEHRRAVKPSQIPAVVAAIAGALQVGGGGAAQASGLPAEVQSFVTALVGDIRSAPGRRAVFVAGHRQPAEVHAAVAAINAAVNAPVDYYPEPEDPRAERDWQPHIQQIQAFKAAAATASAVMVLGANPVLTAPADLEIAQALAAAKLSIHAGAYEDETAQACQWHLPLAHYLEAWGDVRTFDGTVSITQPLIQPLFGAKSAIEILAMITTGQERSGYDIVREVARATYLRNFSEWNWKSALFEGVIPNSGWQAEPLRVDPARAAAAMGALAQLKAGEGYELAFQIGQAYDGRYANNGWLQELPDPMTRVTWENPATISQATAQKLGVKSDDVITLKAGSQEIRAVVFVMPGVADDTLCMAYGYGRKNLGAISEGIGNNVYAIRTAANAGFVPNLQVGKNGEWAIVAGVQDHHIIDEVGRKRLHTIVPDLVVEGVLEQYRKKPALGARKVVALSMWNEHKYDPTDPLIQAKWGMAIDLNTCTGCSACVIACQAENNIPVVGKEQVYRGREMHWLRIDRYFKWSKFSDKDFTEQGSPQVVHQPILCMHCETAPCEEVCPVAATTHSKEGLNMMTYNRCIGTRYCSNNCPYKVRRFNFFDFNAGQNQGEKANLYTPNLLRSDLNELVKMQKNPQVTVRSRGVMEKCTYCVQRIEAARIQLRAENRTSANTAKFKDGAVITACQQACPTDAIVFGDLNMDGKDGRPLSKVKALHNLAQSYGLLDPELNTKPRTVYLAKVRNPSAGLDTELYNEHTASKGLFWTRGDHSAGHGAPATQGAGSATPGGH